MSDIDREATVPEDHNAATTVVLPNGEFNTLRVYMLTLFCNIICKCPRQKTVFDLIISIFFSKNILVMNHLEIEIKM